MTDFKIMDVYFKRTKKQNPKNNKTKQKTIINWVWWHTPLILALGRQRQR
jgi:heme/copper-type cytochrome/quinol oxidase subunit 2